MSHETMIGLVVGILAPLVLGYTLVFFERRKRKHEPKFAEAVRIPLQCSKCGHKGALVTRTEPEAGGGA